MFASAAPMHPESQEILRHQSFQQGVQSHDRICLDQSLRNNIVFQEEDASVQFTKTKLLGPICLVSGRTHADVIPLEIASLIYPGLEELIERPQIKREESFKDQLLRNKDFVADYSDRRARADYAGSNPESALTKAAADVSKICTRFADSNHLCHNGYLFLLVRGDKYVAQPRRRRSKLRKIGEDSKLKLGVQQEHKIRGPIRLVTYLVRKIMTPNILYLTMVNLLSEAEVAEVAEVRKQLGTDQKGIKDCLAQVMEA